MRQVVDLEAFFDPDGVALIGSIDRSATEEAIRAVNDDRWGPGNWHLVNPRGGSVGTIRIHTTITEIPGPVTLAVLSVPAAVCADIVRECGAAGVRFALVFSAGFSEVGPAGAALERDLTAAAIESGIRLIGPNTNMNAFERLPDPSELRGGRIGVITQSGHNGRPIVQGADFGIGFSRLIPTGNEADVDVCDFIEYLCNDDRTAVIAAYVEGFRDGKRLERALEAALEASKPIVAMKIGSSAAGARMAQTHTGHLAGSDSIIDAIFERHAVTRVRDLDELLETSALFAKLPKDTGPRMAMYSISGGSGTLMAELAELHGVPLATLNEETKQRLRIHIADHLTVDNPIDNGGTFVLTQPPEVRQQVLRDIAADPGVDAIVIGITGAVPPITDLLAADILELADRLDKPIIATWNSPRIDDPGFEVLVRSGVPIFRSFRNCFSALAAFESQRTRRAQHRRRSVDRGDLPDGPWAQTATPQPQVLGARDSHELLRRAGVSVVEQYVVGSAGDAQTAATQLGVPTAMKVVSPDIAHKSDLGLVRLGVGADEAATVFGELMQAARKCSGASIEGVLMQPMINGGFEVLVGVVTDPVLGHAIAVGTGGVYAEILEDTIVRPLPIDERDAREMIESIRGYPILAGARGGPTRDIDALVGIVVGVGRLAVALGDRLGELDCNPVVVTSDGAHVVDSLIVLARQPDEIGPSHE